MKDELNFLIFDMISFWITNRVKDVSEEIFLDNIEKVLAIEFDNFIDSVYGTIESFEP